jgi:D-3-phosphoglycerate dehydrogenase
MSSSSSSSSSSSENGHAPSQQTSFPKSKIKILLLEGVAEEGVKILRQEGFNVEEHKGKLPSKELAEKIRAAHCVGIRSGTKLPKELLSLGNRLLCVGCFCIGSEQVDLDAAQALGVPVFNSPFCNTRSVAELIVAAIISLSRRLGDKNKEIHSGIWNKSAKGCHEVRGKTLGIIGYGHIGSQLSVMAEALGMRVLFHDIIPKLPLGNSKQVADLDALLQESDFVSLHVPATPETKNMIGEAQINLMKKGSFLLNASRGTVVVIPDLVKALKSNHLAGAYVDVFPSDMEPGGYTENWECELRGCPNTILTPHIGGSTEEAQTSISVDVATKIANFINAGSTIGAVNFPEIGLPYGGPQTHRILNIHRNKPGVLRDINMILGDFNVTRQILGTAGEIGYLVVEVDRAASKPVKEAIARLDANVRTRILF